MRAPFQVGDFPAPVKYGYASVGRVIEGPHELLMRAVFCLHPHQTCYVVPQSAVFPIPDAVPASRAVLAANLETALNGVWDAGIGPGDRVAVVGAGTVGCLAAWLVSRITGCEVELIDVNSRRAAVAQALGVRFAEPGAAHGEADVVLHASGTAEGLSVALRLAAFEAVVVELSWYGETQVTVPLGEAFHSRRLTLRSSQVGAVAQARRARWNTQRRMRLAISLLTDPVLDRLINSESRFEELPEVMHRLSSMPGDVLMHRVRYG